MAEVKIEITAHDKASPAFNAVAAGSKNAADGVGTFDHACSKATSSAFDFIKGLAGWDAIKQAARWVKDLAMGMLDTTSSAEKTQIMLDRMMGSAAKGKEAFGWLLDFSTQAPFSIDALKDSFVKLQVSGLDPMSGKLQILTDSIAAFGGGSDELKRASIAIQQMAGKGVISMEELRQQIGEVLPTAMQLMAKEMGLSMADFNKQVALGALDAKTGLNALFTGLEKEYKGAGEGMMNSWSGIMAYLSALWTKFVLKISESGAFDSLKTAAKDVKTWIEEAFESGKVKEWASNISSAVSTAIDVIKGLGSVAVFTAKHVDDLVVAMTALAAVQLANAISAGAFSLTGLAAAANLANAAFMKMLPGLAAVAGYELGKKIDEWTYKLTKIDLSGVNRLNEAEKWIAENQTFITKRLAERQAKHTEVTGAAIAEEKNNEEAIKASIKSLQDLSSIIDKIGSQDLKFGGEAFTQGIKDQQQSITGMQAALEGYLGTVENVYGRQIELQKEVTDAMKMGGANPAELAKAQAEAFNTEIALASARLAAWKQYYGALQNAHSAAMDRMKQKTEELNKIEVDRAVQWNSYADIQNSLRQKLMSGEEKYYDQLGILSQQYNLALALEGDAKIKALEDWQKARASMASAVTEGDTVIISQEKAVATAMADIANAQAEIGNAYDQVQAKRQTEIEQIGVWQIEIETAMAKASEMIGLYQQQITSLDEQLATQRVLAVDVEKAKVGVQMIKDFILSDLDPAVSKDRKLAIDPAPAIAATGAVQAAINSIPDVSYKQVVVSYVYTGSPSMPFTEGIDYVKDKISSVPTEGAYTMDFGNFNQSVDSIIDKIANLKSLLASNKAAGSGISDMGGSVNAGYQAQLDVYQQYLGSYATGTDYVPKTGPYLLHQGEKVTPANQAGQGRGNTYITNTISPNINIYAQNKTSDQIVREMAKPIEAELRRLAAIK